MSNEGARDQTLLQVSDLRLNVQSRRVSVADGAVNLCPVEYELLRALMTRPGQVWSPAQLEVWLRSLGRMTGRAAVPVHIHHLRRKIGGAHIRTVRGAGYLVPSGGTPW